MRFFHFIYDGHQGLATQVADWTWRGLTDADVGYPGSLDDLVRMGGFAAAAKTLSSGEAINPKNIVYDLPFKRSSKIFCVGLNYADHAAEANMQLPEFPTVFVRFNENLIAHGAPMVVPNVSPQLDFEAELVAVIGRGGRGISREDALDHVVGYTIFNDGSVRDYQLRVNQWTMGKNFDDTGVLGPVFVTSDELPKGASGLAIKTRVNGNVMQDSNTKYLIFSVEELVHQLSMGTTLSPGDLIVTGTPAGVGVARDPKVFMKDGDICEVEIEGIGVLRNPVVAQARAAS